jgi:hypothetical protein
MRVKLILSILLFCAIIKAQTPTELKDFINKNNIAIRAVQKNMLRETNVGYVSTFKELLKNQETAIKLYNNDKNASAYYAFLVRNESLDFLKKYSKGSIEYYEITEAEKSFSKSTSEKNNKTLSSNEIKAIDNLDAMNPQSLNNIILTIQ